MKRSTTHTVAQGLAQVERSRILRNSAWWLLLPLTAAGVGGIFAAEAELWEAVVPLLIATIALIFLTVYAFSHNRSIREQYARKVLKPTIEQMGYRYSAIGGLAARHFHAPGIYTGKLNSLQCEHQISGEVGAVNFSAVMVNARERFSAGGLGNSAAMLGYVVPSTSTNTTIWFGLRLLLSGMNSIAGKVVVMPVMERITNEWDEQEVKQLDYVRRTPGLEQFLTADLEFSKQFCVFTDNQMVADQLLTPWFRNHLLRLRASLGSAIALCFDRGRLYVHLQRSESIFQVKKTRKIDQHLLKAHKQEFQNVMQLVESLKALNPPNHQPSKVNQIQQT